MTYLNTMGEDLITNEMSMKFNMLGAGMKDRIVGKGSRLILSHHRIGVKGKEMRNSNRREQSQRTSQAA